MSSTLLRYACFLAIPWLCSWGCGTPGDKTQAPPAAASKPAASPPTVAPTPMDKARFEGILSQQANAKTAARPPAGAEPPAPSSAAPTGAEGEKVVSVTGIAKNAALGAVLVQDDRTPVYIEGLSAWDSTLLNTRIEARGLLVSRKLAPDPKIGPDGAVSHGMQGSSQVLSQAKWAPSSGTTAP